MTMTTYLSHKPHCDNVELKDLAEETSRATGRVYFVESYVAHVTKRLFAPNKEHRAVNLYLLVSPNMSLDRMEDTKQYTGEYQIFACVSNEREAFAYLYGVLSGVNNGKARIAPPHAVVEGGPGPKGVGLGLGGPGGLGTVIAGVMPTEKPESEPRWTLTDARYASPYFINVREDLSSVHYNPRVVFIGEDIYSEALIGLYNYATKNNEKLVVFYVTPIPGECLSALVVRAIQNKNCLVVEHNLSSMEILAEALQVPIVTDVSQLTLENYPTTLGKVSCVVASDTCVKVYE